jgi:hypothetical protein
LTSDKKNTFSQIRKILGYTFPFILTVVFLIAAFKNVDVVESFRLISKISIPWFFLFYFFFFFGHYLRAVRWKVIISSVKKDTSMLNLMGATMVGYGVNCIVPRLGEIYRPAFLGKWENVSRSSIFGTIIVERIIDLLALGIAVLISVMIFPGNLYTEFPWLKSTLYLGFAAMAVLILVLFLTVKLKHKFYDIIIKFVGKISSKAADKLAYVFEMLTDGFSSLKGSRNYFLTILLTIIIMLVYGYTSYLGFYVLRMNEIKDITYGMAWIVMSIAAFGIVVPTPGGTGSYHAFVMLVLGQILHFNNEISGAYALFTHIISYLSFIYQLSYLFPLLTDGV